VGLTDNLVAEDGSIAIRIGKDEVCRHLVKRLRKPIVSTSANISGEPSPKNFSEVSDHIRTAVDHVVAWRQDDTSAALPSQIVKWDNSGAKTVIRS
jgi:L-threonylcarbamoyladenylate synthase